MSIASLGLRRPVSLLCEDLFDQEAVGTEPDGCLRLRESDHSHSRVRLMAFCVATAWLLRLIVTFFVYKGFLDPARDHWEFGYELGRIAKSIVQGRGFCNPFWGETGPTAWVTPVFPYLFAGIFRVLGVQTKAAAIGILSLNGLFSALTCIPIFFIAKRSFGITAARLAMWLWAFFPYAIYFSADSMWYHSLLALLLTTSFLVALHLEERASGILRWICFGLLSAVSALTSPVTLSVFPLLLGWACYRRRLQGLNYIGLGTAAIVSLLAVLTPWLVRNDRAFNALVFVKDDFWMEVCVGNLGNSLHWWNGDVHPAGNLAEAARFEELGEQVYLSEKRRQALAFIRAQPGLFLLRSVRRAAYMWTGFWSFQREYLREEPFDPWNILFCSCFSALILLGFRHLSGTTPMAIPFALVMLVFPLVYYISHPDIGYRLAIDPEGVVIVSSLLSRKRIRSDRENAPRQGTHSSFSNEPPVVAGVYRNHSWHPILIGLAASIAICTLFVSNGYAQSDDSGEEQGPAVVPLNTDRILGIIPDYQTVRDSNGLVAPMTDKQKWGLVWKGISDPFNVGSAALNSALAEFGSAPAYGHGVSAYGKRTAAAMADLATQSAASGGALACLLHQDPRYFRKGGSGVFSRAGYAVSRIWITRQDSGKEAFNATGIFGMLIGIGASNLYYPSADRQATFAARRVGNTLANDVVGNVVSEFWPDIQKRFFRRKGTQH